MKVWEKNYLRKRNGCFTVNMFLVFVFRVLQPVIRKKKSPPSSPALFHEFSTVLIKEFSKQEVANLRRKVTAQLMKVQNFYIVNFYIVKDVCLLEAEHPKKKRLVRRNYLRKRNGCFT